MGLKRGDVLNMVFPPECAGCRELTDAPHGLCPNCWREAHFISGAVCRCCGAPVPTAAPGEAPICEGCAAAPPSWDRGRAAVLYDGKARDIILRYKHRDRLDLAPVLARWMARAGSTFLREADLIAPVPLHWTRLIMRRANQSAELARRPELGARGVVVPDLLSRTRATRSLKGQDRTQRQAILRSAIIATPRHAARLAGAHVLLIDDVITTGATLSACAEACRAAGARAVDVLVIARVAREGFTAI